MRKALLITLEYPPQIGGVANYYANLIGSFPVGQIKILTNDTYKLVAKKWLWPKWLIAFCSIYRYVKKEKIEVLLIGQVLPLGTVAWILNKLFNLPYFVFTHALDITHPQTYRRKKWLLSKILESAEQIITVSEFTRQEIKKIIHGPNQHRITIISPGPNITPERYPHNPAFINLKEYVNRQILLSVGRLVERKGHDQVIKALPHIVKHNPNIIYVVVGQGIYLDKLQRLAKDLAVEQYVHFVGPLTNIQLAAMYRRATLFVMPSRELSNRDVEGFGIVYLEANSFYKPVIAGQSGGIQDAVIDGVTGFVVDPLDTQMLAKAILKILDHPELGLKMGEQGARRVQEKFSWPQQAQRLGQLLSGFK